MSPSFHQNLLCLRPASHARSVSQSVSQVRKLKDALPLKILRVWIHIIETKSVKVLRLLSAAQKCNQLN